MTSTTQLTPLRSETPTVTLEVMAREAAVSQWSDRPVVQVLRYQVQIRPVGGEGLPVEIRGDRDGFLALDQAINSYIQADLADLPDPAGDRAAPGPYLEAQALTRHTLHLGNQRTTTGAPSVALGAVQLADLGDAFSQLEAQVRILPVSLAPAKRQGAWRQWGTAAAGLVAAVGLTTALWPTYQSQREVGETALEAPPPETVSPAGGAQENRGSPAIESAPEDPPQAPTPTVDAPIAESAAEDPARIVIESAPKTDAASSTEAAPARKPASPSPQTAAAPPSPGSPAASSPVPSSSESARAPQQRTPENAPANSIASREAPPMDEAMEAAGAPEPFSATNDTDLGTTPRGAMTATPLTLEALAAAIADHWAPPDSLAQSLTYTLTVAADGTLTAITPADEVAEQSRDRAGLPALDSLILPPGDVRQVRVVLAPDGHVEAMELPAGNDDR